MLSTKRNGTALLTAPFQSGYLYPTHDMTRLITHSFPSLNSKNSYPIFSANSGLYDECLRSRSIILPIRRRVSISSQSIGDKCRLFNLSKFPKANGQNSVLSGKHNLQILIRSLSNRPAYGNQVLRGDVGVQKLVKSGIMVGVPKTPRPRESYAWHKQTINGMPHRKRNRLPRHTARTTTCFQTVRSHLTGLLCLLDCP